MLAGGAVLLAGLFADGWAHTNIVDELESFLTPYHVLIFVGFLLAGTAVVRAAQRRRTSATSLWQATPTTYRPALLGVVGFAVGFTGDGVWHTVFGIENGVDALLSPTHLLMAVSLVAVLSAPLRAWDATRRPGEPMPWRAAGSVLASTLVVAFFLMYAWATRSNLILVATSDELFQTAGLMQGIVTTAVLAGGAAALLRRGSPPPGALSAVVVGVPVGIHLMVELANVERVLGFVLGAVLLELAARSPLVDRLDVVLPAFAVVSWTGVWVVVATLQEGTAWSAELVTGQVVLAALTAWWVARRDAPSTLPA